MTILYLLQSIAISLGVGASTLTILNFFTAIKDGNIDVSERQLMGVGYTVLRVAMGLILLSTAALLFLTAYIGAAVGGYLLLQLLVVVVLFANAVGMTKRWIPSTLGPGIQAGSWYALGLLAALQAQDVAPVTLPQFVFLYVVWLVFMVVLVNGAMKLLGQRGR